MMNNIYKITILFLLSFSASFAQEKLTKENAINIALENNYGIKIAKNKLKIAENNASIYNSGYLPKVTANAGANYNNNSSEFTSQRGDNSEINNAESKLYNASIGLNYTLFDGLGRTYNYKKLKETYNLSELEAQAIIENSVLQIFTIYYDVAQLTEDELNILESLKISKQRLERANYSFDYGQSTKLQVLNAEVDVNNDSIRYINTKRFLANSKRDLNLLLGRTITTNFTVDTDVSFNLIFDYQNLLEKGKKHNIEMQKVAKSIELSDFDIKISKASLYPILNFNSSYGFNKSHNDSSFTNSEQVSKGFNAGVSLNWNLFDSGNTKTRIQNSKIVADNLLVQKEQIENEIERTIANALEIYNNALFILKAEEKNVETNKRNFSRTEEQFKLGQITSIEFRQAQVNLLNAQSNFNLAKYDAKNAELKLLQLTGELLNKEF
ncbi:MAG: TolC family protein [Lutibacter sp.]|nr:TolC family protein [Lutibacter sp.]